MKEVLSQKSTHVKETEKVKNHEAFNQVEIYILKHLKKKHSHPLILSFNIFAKKISDIVGNAWAFIAALLVVLIWGISGYYFRFSDTWQLVINTGTTIVTFLVVFLIQNTQNRDTEIINIKLDELIRAHKGAKNTLINLSNLSDIELKNLEIEYNKLINKRTGQ